VLCTIHLVTQHETLTNQVHTVPPTIDQEVARLKLAAMNMQIDALTAEQQQYLSSWQEGT